MTCHRSKPSVITLKQRTQPLELRHHRHQFVHNPPSQLRVHRRNRHNQFRQVVSVTLDRKVVPLPNMVTDPHMTATVQRLHPPHVTRRLKHVRFVLLHPVTTRYTTPATVTTVATLKHLRATR